MLSLIIFFVESKSEFKLSSDIQLVQPTKPKQGIPFSHLEKFVPVVGLRAGQPSAFGRAERRRTGVRRRLADVVQMHLPQELVQRVLQDVVVIDFGAVIGAPRRQPLVLIGAVH